MKQLAGSQISYFLEMHLYSFPWQNMVWRPAVVVSSCSVWPPDTDQSIVNATTT